MRKPRPREVIQVVRDRIWTHISWGFLKESIKVDMLFSKYIIKICILPQIFKTSVFLTLSSWLCHIVKAVFGLWLSVKNTFHIMIQHTYMCCCCYVASVGSDSVWPHRRQPTRLTRPWDSPGKNTGVGCHFFLQCMKVKSESEVVQLCPTPSDPMDCSLPGSSVHGIFQATVLEWVAIAFSDMCLHLHIIKIKVMKFLPCDNCWYILIYSVLFYSFSW